MTTIFTRAVHAGEHTPTSDFTPTSTPIHMAASYFYETMDELDAVFGQTKEGFSYRRYGNPTLHALENALAELDEGDVAVTYGSGMAAIHAALLGAGVKAGSHVVAARDCYGATYTLLNRLFAEQGVITHFVDVADLAEVESVLAKTNAVAVICETVSNPLIKVANIAALADAAHRADAQLVVDSTFTTPYLFRPLTVGADFVVHSLTKYIGGHDDVLGGAVITRAAQHPRLFEQLKMIGANLSPFEAWLALRGLKTLPLRMRQHCASALQVATWLAQHPRVTRVNYPGLPSHSQHALAASLFIAPDGQPAFGGMLSFELSNATASDVMCFMEKLQLILPAPTLGDVYSLVLYPARTSHRALTPEQRAEVGIHENLVRLSIGIEDAQDIIADLEQALAA